MTPKQREALYDRCRDGLHGSQVVTPMVAKAKRVRQKHIGARERGKGYRPMPCGRRSAWKKKISGEVVKR